MECTPMRQDELLLDNETAPLSINDHIISSYSPCIQKPAIFAPSFQRTPSFIRKFSFSLEDFSTNQETNLLNINPTITSGTSRRPLTPLNFKGPRNGVGKLKKYDHVQSKVKGYIDEIKEKKRGRTPDKLSPRSDEFYFSEDSNDKINRLKEKLRDKDNYISELHDQKYDLQAKLLELKNILKDTKFELSNAKAKLKYECKMNSLISSSTQTEELQSPTFTNPILMTPSYSNRMKNGRKSSKMNIIMKSHNDRRYSVLSVSESPPPGAGYNDEGSNCILNQEDLEYNTTNSKKKRRSSSDSMKNVFIKLFANCGRNKANEICPCATNFNCDNMKLETFGNSRPSISPGQDEGFERSLSYLEQPSDMHKILRYVEELEEKSKAIKDIAEKINADALCKRC